MASDASSHSDIASRLAQLRAVIEDTLRDPVFTEACGIDPLLLRGDAALIGLAERHVAERRDRGRVFGADADIVSDAAWNIMLHLFIWHGRQRVSVSAACYSSFSPYTTSLRWLERLEEQHLVVRSKHPTDGRSASVALSEDGMAKVAAVLSYEMARLKERSL